MTSSPDIGWTRPRPELTELRADAGLAVLLAFASLTMALLYQRTALFGDDTAEPWVWAVGIGLATLPLALRRRHPVPVVIVVSVGYFVCGQFIVPDTFVINISMFLALYTVGAWEQNRRLALWSRLSITALMVIWLVVTLLISSYDAETLPGLSRSGIFSAYATFAAIQTITTLTYHGGAYFFGERSWRAARSQALLEARGQELDRERETSAAQAVALERLSIARELHDVVAHHVSVMGIQAAAARRSLEKDPALAAEALAVVEDSAHTAVTELRRLVHTLRTPENEDSSSTVGVAQIPALVEEARRSGTPTTFIVVGNPRPLPLLVDVALYRVVQESLTNVRKHAGLRAEATVRLRFTEDAAEVEVSDDGVRTTLGSQPVGSPGSSPGSRSGLGLRGMRERVGAVGGFVVAERRERGGFLVRATVPNTSTAVPGGGSQKTPDMIETPDISGSEEASP